MKYRPLKKFLGKPFKLLSGNVYYEKVLDRAIQKYEAQFKHSEKWLPTDADIMRWSKEFNETDIEAQAQFRVMAKFMKLCMKEK